MKLILAYVLWTMDLTRCYKTDFLRLLLTNLACARYRWLSKPLNRKGGGVSFLAKVGTLFVNKVDSYFNKYLFVKWLTAAMLKALNFLLIKYLEILHVQNGLPWI